MQTAGAEDLRREFELDPPVGDDLTPEEAARPTVHLAGDLLGDREKQRISGDGQLQVALVVERHRRHLPEGVLAVEHPAVGAGEQRVGDVAQTDGDVVRRSRPCCRTGALDPLAAEVRRNLRTAESTVAGILNTYRRTVDERFGIEELDAPPLASAILAALEAFRHEPQPVAIVRRQRFAGGGRVGRPDVGVFAPHRIPPLELRHRRPPPRILPLLPRCGNQAGEGPPSGSPCRS